MFIMSEEQKLEWNDILFLKGLPFQSTKMNAWPHNPNKFRETVMKYIEGMREVAISIVKYISMVLGIEDSGLCEAYKEGNYDIRMNLYPPCPQPERVIGLNQHIDVHGITLLLDCAHSPALQVLKEGNWVFVQPIEHALVVDLGGIIEIMSNGIYKSPIHKAVVNKSEERISIVTLCNPNPSFTIGPAERLINSGMPAMYKTVTLDEYFQCFYNSKPGTLFMDNLKL
ncbi:oxoglutarate-dependent flavonoid 7-O-demethylase 1-like [Mercurialis annua]|uniref:oxoglutarate-dependent flavonoid 7-O-demethylase 1-like n=1 Tax=Mercurialis annua TaxID=3986 RepID=UPI00215F3532|nr:oxoglutarate-dependent flavonoid 7-O-demethylase 1-like [Mercurialis annua]